MNKLVLICCFTLIAGGCTSVSSLDRPSNYYSYQPQENNGPGLAAQGNLIDQEFEQLINHHLQLPPLSRVAILKMSTDSYWRYYSNDFTLLNDQIAANFVGTLRDSNRVYDASFLPTMLIPEQRTVNFLREAAARFQADLLLVYRSACHSFEKYRLIRASESQAYCAVEAVLLDVRTGIVPFTSVASQQFHTKEGDNDINFQETIKRAELEALAQALQEVAKNVVNFLDGSV